MAVSLGGFGERGLDAYQALLDGGDAERLAEAYAGMRGDDVFGANAPAPGYVKRVLTGQEDPDTEGRRIVEYVVDEVVEQVMRRSDPGWAERLVSFEIDGLDGTYRSIGRGGYKHGHRDADGETVLLTFHAEDTLRGELEQAETARHNMETARECGVPVATTYDTVLVDGDEGTRAALVGDYRGDLVEPGAYAAYLAERDGAEEAVARQYVHDTVREAIVEPLLDLYEEGKIAYRGPDEIRMMDVLHGNVGFDPDTGEPYLLDAGELGDGTFTGPEMPHASRDAFLEAHSIDNRVDALLTGMHDDGAPGTAPA